MALISLALANGVTAQDLEPFESIHHGLAPGGPALFTNQDAHFGWAITPFGNDSFAVSAPRQRRTRVFPSLQVTLNVGAVYIHDLEGSRIRTISHPDPNENDQFGYAIARVGTDRLLVGAPLWDNQRVGGSPDVGIAYLFDQAGVLLDSIVDPNQKQGSWFGASLSAVGTDRFLIGAYLGDGGAVMSGRAYLYSADGSLLQTINNPSPQFHDYFGLAMSGLGSDRFLIGAPRDNTKASNAGRVYLYNVNGVLLQDFTPLDVESGDHFGASVAEIGGNRFVVGAPFRSVNTLEGADTVTIGAAGAVYLFDHNATRLKRVDNPEPLLGARFGSMAARVGNDRFLVGASDRDNARGKAYLFTADGELLARIANPFPANADFFGQGMAAIGEEHFVIGAPGDDFYESNAGSAYLYHAPIMEYQLGFEIPRPNELEGDPLFPTGPEVVPSDAAYWHAHEKKLYATKPGKILIRWINSEVDYTNIVQGFNIWPANESLYQIHVANSPPVDLYPHARLMHQDAGMDTSEEQVQSQQQFQAFQAGQSLLLLAPGSPNSNPVFFQVLKTVAWDDPAHLHDGVPATIGEAIADDFEYHAAAGGFPFVYWEKSRYCPLPNFYDRSARTGPIYPVNVDDPATVEDDLVLIYYQQGTRLIAGNGDVVDSPLFWPWKPVRYAAEWPSEPEKIIIASQMGSGAIDPVLYPEWDIYYQNDPDLPGFNPNDEHALRRPYGAGEAIFALRDDLGTPLTSEPYVLMHYLDGDQGALKVFKVVAEEAPYFFHYPGTAGTIVQPPFPLSTLQLCSNSEGVSGPYWRDRKESFWARAAGDNGGPADIVMRFHYPVQIGFFFPEGNPPDPGTCIPWLDLRAGTPGVPHDITYEITWPPLAPELRVGETLVKPKAGLPDISLQSSVEIIYQQGVALGQGSSVQLIDPTREYAVPLDQLPSDAVTVSQGGWTYFPTLPPQLRGRFRYHPPSQTLRFRGELIEVVAGLEPYYLLLNVITPREKAILAGLSTEAAFQNALNSLATTAAQPIFVAADATAFDSLALTAGFAQGTGYVTIAFGNNPELSPPAEPVSLEIIQVTCPLYRGEIKVIESENPFDEKLTLRHSGDFAGRTPEYIFEWRTLPPVDGLPSTAAPDQWTIFLGIPASGQGVVDVTIEGAGLATLSDNYFICRYRPTALDNPCGADWSDWTDPMLAEGWIKRVLRGINPFEQRIQSYGDTAVNTIVSMISQAGTRAIGNVPLNLQAAEEFGLIEIYETVLKRGESLSIKGTPAVNYPPANDALLMVAGRLADLYMLLGNEAFADAADPTIAFGTDHGQYGSEASSIHCFMNQVPSLLEEELALLRGRDNRFLPSVATYPFYNRLIWNFTSDINGGEVAYALNYNIQDAAGNADGVIDEADARRLYPQGHGDAWGHYLMAIKNYYRLLRNPNFTWVPRIEAVLVGGVPVSVDFLDERKFAHAAAARARAGAEIVNLTYRQHYVEDPQGQYQGYQDSDPDRAWGLAEWGSRTGQGTFFDWVMANAILPDVDPNPAHTGIQKVDRTTVTELRDLPSAFDQIQAQVDIADQGLNPLGLAKNVVPFDIDPAAIAQGKTHFEQIFDRAVKAMNNAIAVFNHANNSTQLLRRQADTVVEFQKNVQNREADFNNRLIEIFGYPYSNDIGPGGAYPSGYEGPDIYHYDYFDPTELLGETPPPTQTLTLQVVEFGVSAGGGLTESSRNVTFHLSTTGLGLVKPVSWTGKRRAPGEVQMARSDFLQMKARFERSLIEYQGLVARIQEQANLLEAQYGVHANEITILNTSLQEQTRLNSEIETAFATELEIRHNAKYITATANALAEFLPKVVGISSDMTAPARGAGQLMGVLMSQIVLEGAEGAAKRQLRHRQAKEIAQAATNLELTTLRSDFAIVQQLAQLEQTVRQEAGVRLELFTLQEAMNQSAGRYLATLARGQRVLEERLRFRKETAAQVQAYRYKDMAFRIFRNDALQKYRAQFDMAARYVYLAAAAYDFETNLNEGDPRGPGAHFFTQIVRSRSLGLIQNGLPLTGAGQGDPGLADPLAKMFLNWDLVLKGQLGFNNPQTETGRFSLRSELFRIQPGFQGSAVWRETLSRHVVPNLLDLPEFQRYCIGFQPQQAVEPAIVIPFSTTVNFGHNFFGWPAGGGDNSYDSSHFATKIRSVGIWFANYNNLGSGMINTPRVYLVPVGSDVMRSPSSQTGQTREWKILDQTLPVPFPLSGAALAQPGWIPLNDTLNEGLADIRRYASFRAYHDSGIFDASETINNTRLIGRSVWNTQWLLIIPAGTLHSDRNEAIARFTYGALLPDGSRDGNGVTDVRIFFQTYSFAGN